MTPRPAFAPLGLAVAGAALAGVACVQLWPSLPPAATAWATFALGVFLHWRGRRQARLVGAFALGLAWVCLAGVQRLDQRVSEGRFDATVVGSVRGLPQADARGVRFDFAVDDAGAGPLAGRRLRLAWYDRAEPPEPGSRWSLAVRVRPPHGVADPGGFDAERQAIVEGTDGLGYVRGEARRLAPGGGVDAWRARLSALIAARAASADARFLRALVLGDTRWLQDRDWEVLRATGLTHLIAISGFHVGLVAMLGGWGVFAAYRLVPGLGRRLPRPVAAAAGALLVAAAYTALVGFALPTVRTWLMLAAVLLGRAARRGQGGTDAFALALLVVLAAAPLSVLAPGFWLSFAGVGWLLWCLPSRRDEPRWRPFLAAQGVALVGLLPLVVGFFGQVSIVAPLTNLLAIPVISFGVVPLALAGTAALALPGPVGAGLLDAADALMGALWQVVEIAAASPHDLLVPPEPGWPALVFAALGAAWLLMPRGTPGRALGGVLMLPLLWPAPDALPAGQARIDVLDVGQGLSVLVRTRDHALLYDAGPGDAQGFDHGAATVVPALRALGVSRLDAIVASHGDGDHVGGLASVRAAFPEATLYAPPGWGPADARPCTQARGWHRDGVAFAFLHPPPDFPYLRNDSSCVLHVAARGASALLPGDIGAVVERRLVTAQGPALRVDVIVVPHHGSRTSSVPVFVAAVSPRWAVFATGADNRFALPRPEVVARWRRAGATTLDTADLGAVRFRLGAAGAVLEQRRRQDHPRWWRERRPRH